jgi:hypothetical protein
MYLSFVCLPSKPTMFDCIQKFHRELLSKEGLVEDIRKKAQELLHTRHGVPGDEALQQQLQQLGRCAAGI